MTNGGQKSVYEASKRHHSKYKTVALRREYWYLVAGYADIENIPISQALEQMIDKFFKGVRDGN